MNLLLYILVIFLFIIDYVIYSTDHVPRVLGLIPEFISGIAMLIVCGNFVKHRMIFMPARYLVFFIFFIAFIVLGIVVNQVQPGAIFAGIRMYFRYAPFFLLPLVYQFSDKEISRFVKVLLVFSLLQLPVAIYQKLVIFPTFPTGDVIQGSVLDSGKLAVYLICTISIVLAYYLKERISIYKALLFITILFLPVAITEATASIILLPLAFIVPMIFLSGDKRRVRSLIPVALIGTTFLISFIAIYNLQYSGRWGGDILNTILSGKAAESLYRDSTEKSTAEMKEIGRIDTMILPIKILSKKGVIVLYGTGLGNASDTFSDLLVGEYFWAIDEYGADWTTVSHLLWEIGIIGVLFALTLFFMIFRDAMKLRHNQENSGSISLGWLGVISVIMISMPYTNFLGHNVMGYLIWFFNGYIISKASMINQVSKRDISYTGNLKE